MIAPPLPYVACSILKGVIVSLANAGFLKNADAKHLIAFLGLPNA